MMLITGVMPLSRADGRLFPHGPRRRTDVPALQHRAMIQAQVRKHYQTMKPQIRRFSDKRLTLGGASLFGILGREQCLGGFLADFFQHLVEPLVVQGGDVGVVGAGVAAGFQHLGQGIQHGIGSGGRGLSGGCRHDDVSVGIRGW